MSGCEHNTMRALGALELEQVGGGRRVPQRDMGPKLQLPVGEADECRRGRFRKRLECNLRRG